MPETADGYALAYEGQAHWLVRLMAGQWVSQLRAAHELHIMEIHPRLPDIRRAGGDFDSRECGTGGEKWMEYTLTAQPRIVGQSEARRLSAQIFVPDRNVAPWVPPPATYKSEFRRAA